MAQPKVQSNQLTNTGVTPGSYTTANITVDAAGRITAAATGTAGAIYTAGNLINPTLLATNQIAVRDVGVSPVGGNNNIFIGPGAGTNFTTGTGNVVIGALAGDTATQGSNNVLIGIEAGHGITTGTNNILIGYQAGRQQVINGDGSLSDQFIINNENVRDPSLYSAYLRGRIVGNNSTLQLAGSFFIKADDVDESIRFGLLNTGELELNQDAGNAGEVLTSGGPGAPVFWTTVSGGGSEAQPINQVVYGTGSGITSSPDLTFDEPTGVFTVEGVGTGIIEAPPGEDIKIIANSLIVESIGPSVVEANTGSDLVVIGNKIIFQAGPTPTEWLAIGPNGEIFIDGTEGEVGQVLTSNGSGTGAMWADAGGGGAVTLTGDVTGTGTGTVATTLADTLVVPGSYTRANITIDSKGRITSAANGSSGTPGGTDTQVQFNDGGIFGGDSKFIWTKTSGGKLTLGVPGSTTQIATPDGVGTDVADLGISAGSSPGSVAGGTVTIQSGFGNTGPSGNVSILTTGAGGTGTAGTIALTGGQGGTTAPGGTGGAITLRGGAGGGSGAGSHGGTVSIFGGNPGTSGRRGNVNIGGVFSGTLATNATGGFITIPTCPGIPTGVPGNIPVGQAPMIYDSTNNKLYVRNIGNTAWVDVSATTVIQVAASDETTALTTGVAKVTFRMPHAMTLSSVRASLTTAQVGGTIFTVDIKEAGTSIMTTTKLTINNGSKTSVGATTPPVITDTALADDAEITVDITQIGDGTAKGLKITLIGIR